MLLTQPLLTYPGCLYFGSLLCWKSQSWPHICMAPSILSSICCSRQAPSTPQAWSFGMVFLGMFSFSFFLQTWCVEFIPKKKSSSHLTTLPSAMPLLDHPDGHLRTSDGLDMWCPKQSTMCTLQDFRLYIRIPQALIGLPIYTFVSVKNCKIGVISILFLPIVWV